MSGKKEPGTTDILSYSEGELQIVNALGTPQFYLTGILPGTPSVKIRSAWRQGHDATIYTNFLQSVKENDTSK